MAEDDIVHLIDDPGDRPPDQGPRWKIAVIDDEPAVHDGTRFALSDYRLNGQGLEILSAYSAAEGRELMRRHADVAVVLLDVIMESDTAGLGLVEYIRNDLKNETVRIILRTGQQGQDRTHGRQAVHVFDRGAAQLPATAADGGNPPRARNHHRGGIDFVRLQVDAAAGGRRSHPDRVVAQCRVRRNSGLA